MPVDYVLHQFRPSHGLLPMVALGPMRISVTIYMPSSVALSHNMPPSLRISVLDIYIVQNGI